MTSVWLYFCETHAHACTILGICFIDCAHILLTSCTFCKMDARFSNLHVHFICISRKCVQFIKLACKIESTHANYQIMMHFNEDVRASY